MTSHYGHPTTHTTATSAGYANPGTNAYDAGATTGEKLQSRIPGTAAHQERKAAEGVYNPNSTTTGAGYGSTTHPTGATGTHATHGSTTGTRPGGGLASKVPGTAAYEQTHPYSSSGTGTTGATGADYGSSTTGAGYGTGTHHAGTTGATGTGGAGIAAKVPGTKAHAATHGDHHATHASNVSSSTGLQPGAPGTTTTTTTTTVPKPSTGDKISGKVDVAIGKLTHNPGKVAIGEIKQTEGKAGVAQAGLSGTHGAGTTGHTVAGGGAHTTGRY
ncbi:hypothetical protein JCM10207_005822 [Rhodosporidiobolus poonsookiae]